MLRTNKAGWTLGILALTTVVSTPSIQACSVPVFRYALEHWPADPYQAVVFHRGPLSDAQELLVRDLGREGMSGRLHANVSPRTIDLDQKVAPDILEFWRRLGTDTVPWLVLRYPLAVRSPDNIWSGPLSESAIRQVVESPARKEIARRLGQGESAVWVLLEIGDPKKDRAAGELLESRLAYLASVLQLPKLDAQDIVNGLVSVTQKDLKLEFSSLRLSRKDEAEQAFVRMLLGIEADLKEIEEPMVFPIFGRGRALYALAGKGINHQTIDEAASFLIGSCSCQVKEQNPGVDLLLAANWDAVLKTPAGAARDLPPLADLPETAPVTVTISGGEETQPSSATEGARQRGPTGKIPLLAGLALVGLMTAGSLLLFKRRS
ncbi:MAG: hypothetical protein HY735_13585 [Verrucomicrobia bacterium]|nr:hypothetical protein [Verrucomicrobiota bacterium]